MAFTPSRVAIEDSKNGPVIAKRRAPRAPFPGHEMNAPWDPLHLTDVNGDRLGIWRPRAIE
jgi:hypothetical protein